MHKLYIFRSSSLSFSCRVGRCTPYFHWAGLQDYADFCRGKSLLCMNKVEGEGEKLWYTRRDFLNLRA